MYVNFTGDYFNVRENNIKTNKTKAARVDCTVELILTKNKLRYNNMHRNKKISGFKKLKITMRQKKKINNAIYLLKYVILYWLIKKKKNVISTLL